MIETLLRERIAGLGGVTALAGARVYLDQLPQSPLYPCVRVSLVDDSDDQHLRGPRDAQHARVQVDAFAQAGSGTDPYATAAALAQAIHGDGLGPGASGISGWIGSVGSPPVTVVGCRRVARTRRYDPDELRVVTMSLDYIVWYREGN
jgi:Protein of unknown function (DUF3168)